MPKDISKGICSKLVSLVSNVIENYRVEKNFKINCIGKYYDETFKECIQARNIIELIGFEYNKNLNAYILEYSQSLEYIKKFKSELVNRINTLL